MTLSQPDVSVIIANYNGARWLDRCLRSLEEQDGGRPEVILVDNASSDGSVELVQARHAWVRVVQLDRNMGFAAANNAGARVASARFLAFLNNDTEAHPQWVSALRGVLEQDPSTALATSRLVFMHDPAVLDSAGDGYTRSGGAFKRGHGRPAATFDADEEVFGACGAAFMIRRAVFDELGGFDEDLFLVYEDVDLSYRAQLLDYRCRYVPGALVRHAGSGTMGTVSRLAVYYGQRNLEWVYLKNTPARLLFLTLPGHAIYSLAGGLYLTAAGHTWTWLTSKAHALAGLPRVLRRRQIVQRSRRTDVRRLWRLMSPGWIGLKWREKRFDLESRRRA